MDSDRTQSRLCVHRPSISIAANSRGLPRRPRAAFAIRACPGSEEESPSIFAEHWAAERPGSSSPSAANSTANHCMTQKLPPSSFDEDVTVMPVLPAGSHPDSMRTRWNLPAARFPNKGIAVPAMIAADPDMPGTRPRRPVFHAHSWWPQLHHDIGSMQRTHAQRNSE
jgi:hypothetical protein